MTTIAALHRRTLLGAAGLGSLGVLGGSPVLLAAGAASLAGVAAAAVDLHAGQRSLARRWAVHAVTVLVVVGALSQVRALQIDTVFIVVMTGVVNRALLRVSSRDDLLIVGGAVALLTAATVVTSGLGFALLLAVSVPTAAAALWTSIMLAGAEHSPAELARMRARRAPRGLWLLGGAALLFTVLGFGVSTLLPRYRFTPFLAAGAFASLPGSSDSMRLDTGGAPDRDDGEVVLYVTPLDGVDQGDLSGLYARLYALDDFDGRTWSSRTGGHFAPAPGMDAAMNGKPKVKLTALRRQRGALHFAMPVLGRDRPWAVSGHGLHYDRSGTMVVDAIGGRAVEYAAGLAVPLHAPKLSPGFAEKEATVVREVPAGIDPRVLELGSRLAEGARDDEEKIARVLDHFAKGFAYSTAPLEGDSPDPLARFLFESRRGHCELYAGAVALLLRIAGVDARVASGYYQGHYNEPGGFLTFSEGDAHAWVEVRPAGGEWRWIDATPEDLRSGRTVSAWRRVRDWYEAASALWYANVVDFDAKRQQAFYNDLSRALEERLRGDRGADGRSRSAGPSLIARASSPWLAVPLAGALLIGVVAWARRARTPEALGRRLRRALGGASEAGSPLGVLAARAGASEAGPAIALYERLRFAPPSERPPRGDVVRAIRALERERTRSRGRDQVK